MVWGAQDSCHSSSPWAGAVVGSETRPRTRHSVDGCDGQQPSHGDVEVPVQGLLNEEGPSIHINLEKNDRYHSWHNDMMMSSADQAVSFVGQTHLVCNR